MLYDAATTLLFCVHRQVRRFIKYNLGEGLEKRSNDFAAEVAQQTAKKAEPAAPKKEEPKKEEALKEVRRTFAGMHCPE
jgi:elongation factor Ts